jgi:hypothetical protein
MLRASQLPCYLRIVHGANDGQPCDLQGKPEAALQFPRPTNPEKTALSICRALQCRCGSAQRPYRR